MPQVKVVDLTRRTGQNNLNSIKNGQEPQYQLYDDPTLSAEDFAFVRKEVILRTERAEGKKKFDLENPL
jgi:hypothetical protein